MFYTVAMISVPGGRVSVTRSLQEDDAQGHECILCQCGLGFGYVWLNLPAKLRRSTELIRPLEPGPSQW